MRIGDLPTRERPRERLATLGPAALADRELLALVLGTGGRPGSGAHHLAERLLGRFGSMAALARAHPGDLLDVSGVGPAKASALTAAFELARRVRLADAGAVIRTTDDLVPLVAPALRGRDRERLVLVVCDTAHRVLSCEVLTEGAADHALLPVREVAVAVLRRDGRAFALAHNHPGGDLTPSPADLAATRQIREAAAALELRFLDHVIVTESGWRRIER